MTSFFKNGEIELNYLMQLERNLSKDKVEPEKYYFTTFMKGNTRYFNQIRTRNGRREVTYLGDAKSKRLRSMARSSYKRELLKAVRHDVKVLKKALSDYRKIDRESVLAKLSPCLRDVMFDIDFDAVMMGLRAWANEDYKRNSNPFKGGVIRAKDGTRVRSKSECIVYNLLLEAGIPFRYDCVIELKRLNKYGEVETYEESPDFLIQCPDGKLIIIEHAGMLSSMQYAANLAGKLQTYQLNGYRFGYTLFVFNDDMGGGIDSQEIDGIISTIKESFPYL